MIFKISKSDGQIAGMNLLFAYIWMTTSKDMLYFYTSDPSSYAVR